MGKKKKKREALPDPRPRFLLPQSPLLLSDRELLRVLLRLIRAWIEIDLGTNCFLRSLSMSATRSLNPIGGATIDPAPLLGTRTGGGDERGRRNGRRPSLRGAARFLRRASSRRMMREPSMVVREAAAEQLEERQRDWAYSRPVVFLDILWNLAFVAAAAGVLVLSREERPSMPLRPWIGGYALQCVLHMVCVCIEYRRRHPSQGEEGSEDGGIGSRESSGPSSPRQVEEGGGYDAEQGQDEEGTR